MGLCKTCWEHHTCEPDFCPRIELAYEIDAKRVSNLPPMVNKPQPLLPREPTMFMDVPNGSQFIHSNTEYILDKIFPSATRVHHSRGYHPLCRRYKKTNAKTSCAHVSMKSLTIAPRWTFNIEHNTIPDHFLFVAFTDLFDLTPLYMWIIPAAEIYHKRTVSISQTRLHKWDKYKIPIDKFLEWWDSRMVILKYKSPPKTSDKDYRIISQMSALLGLDEKTVLT